MGSAYPPLWLRRGALTARLERQAVHLLQLTIDVFTVTDSNDRDFIPDHFIHDPVIPYTYSVSVFVALEFLCAMRIGSRSQF